MQLLKIDNTKRSEFNTCPQKYFLNYVKNIRTVTGSTALRYGIVWHEALDVYYSHIKKHGWTKDGTEITAALEAMKSQWDIETTGLFYNDYRTFDNCIQSFIKYVDHFAYDAGMLEIIETEKAFRFLMEPSGLLLSTYPGLKPFFFTGKMDLLLSLNGRIWLGEHKTTGQPLFKQAKRLTRSSQLHGYTYAGIREAREKKTEPPEGILVNFHHLSAYKSRSKDPMKAGRYSNPKIDFQRDVQIFTEDDLDAWLLTFWETVWRMQRAHKEGIFPKQLDSCFNYGRCQYQNLCMQNREFDDLNLDGFYQGEEWDVSAELDKKEKERK